VGSTSQGEREPGAGLSYNLVELQTSRRYEFKVSATWDHPYLLFIFNTLNLCVCVYLVTPKDILAFISSTSTPVGHCIG
jgi:hypothetical protein